MGTKRMPGLVKRGTTWHINKKVDGVRICESAGTNRLEEAEKYLVRRLETIRQATVYGVRPKHVFREAATRYLLEHQHKASIDDDARTLKLLDKFIGHLPLEAVHMGSLQVFIQARQKEGVKNRTVNYGLEVVRCILNLSASEWLNESGLSWLTAAPKIRLLPRSDQREPYPLNLDEQDRLFNELPLHLKQMALFAVNTGCRDQEICYLRWEWEVLLSDKGSVFIIPRHRVKNREERLVILNRIAASVIESARGQHSEYVFVYQGKPITGMLTSAWKKARIRAELPQVRVHDLKHTFGRRLRAAGVGFEDRQDLLGHKSGRITTHYSAPELCNLIEAANKVCECRRSSPVLRLLRGKDLGEVKVLCRAKVAQGLSVEAVI
jgi:integrase